MTEPVQLSDSMPDSAPDSMPDSMPERPRRYGLARIVQGYALTLLAAILALPVVGAGLITSNNCQIRGYACSDRFAYGLVGASVLAAVTLLMLALHFQLGWSFWIGCALLMTAAALSTGHVPALAVVLMIAPGVAAWFSEPPNRRRGALHHWVPRYAVLVGLMLSSLAVGLVL